MKKLDKNPEILFLVDGAGAILSAFLLGIVLVEFYEIFGIPRPVLYFLAVFPCLFAVYDFYCYRKVGEKIAACLRGIALMNISYCCLSIALALYHYQEIRLLGWIYFAVELMIVFVLAMLEFKIAKNKSWEMS